MTNDDGAPDDAARTVLDTLIARTGQPTKVLLRDEDSALGKSPMIDASASASLRPSAGSLNYQVLGKIAEGGMGAVFKSHDSDLGREVAMKVLLEKHADKPAVLQRFIEEAQIGGQLQHPGIVPVYELGLLEDKRPFFTMKLVKGRTLAAYFAERTGDAGERRRFLKIFEQVCETMAYAHSRRVVHRDLKPANIMVGAFGEVQVVDWGLGKVLTDGGVADERAAARALTDVSIIETLRSSGSSTGSESLVGSVMGTPMYMSPEQARGDVDRLDERTDVFGLGAILCEMLTGKPPYLGDVDAVVIEAARALQDGARERLAASGADAFLVDLVERCLAPNPSVRPRSASVLVEELGKWLTDQEQRARDAEVAKARAEEERKARRLTLMLATTVVVALAGGGFFWQAQQREAASRLQSLTHDVDSLLADAQLDRGRGDLREAMAGAEAAALLVTSSPDADDRLTARVMDLGDTLREELAEADAEAAREAHLAGFLAALEESLGTVNIAGVNDFDKERFVDIEQLFTNIGVDIDGDLEQQAVALRALGRHAHIGEALDEWARLTLSTRGFGADFRRRIELAMLVDDDPSRAMVRRALVDDDRAAFIRLASSPEETADWTPRTAMTFISSVHMLGYRTIEMRPMLRAISKRYPADTLLHGRIAAIDLWRAPDGAFDPIRGLHHASVRYAENPDALFAMTLLGRAQAMNGMVDEATQLVVRMLRVHPDAYYTKWGRGVRFVVQQLPPGEKSREYMRIHEVYAEHRPDDFEMLHDRGWDILNVRDVTPAEIRQGREDALRAMSLSAETSSSWNTVAVASWMLGDRKTMASAAQRSIDLEGPYLTDYAILALAQAADGLLDDARATMASSTLSLVAQDPIEHKIVAAVNALFDKP